MEEQPEMIRSQMDHTRADLSEKLEELESRVSAGLESTGTAVSNTITGIQDVAHSVHELLDIPLQVQRHPWIAFGGAFALGCLLGGRSSKAGQRQPVLQRGFHQLPNSAGVRTFEDQIPGTAADVQPVHHGPVHNAVVDVLQEAVIRGLPLVLDYLFRKVNVAEEDIEPVTDPDSTTLQLSSATGSAIDRPQKRRVY